MSLEKWVNSMDFYSSDVGKPFSKDNIDAYLIGLDRYDGHVRLYYGIRNEHVIGRVRSIIKATRVKDVRWYLIDSDKFKLYDFMAKLRIANEAEDARTEQRLMNELAWVLRDCAIEVVA